MSFLADPPLLYANGRTYGRLTRRRPPAALDRLLGAGVLGLFWGTSVPLYLNRPWTRPLWRVLRARSGRDWMINSGVFRFEHRRVGLRTHLVAALVFATYPFWLWLGWRHGRGERT